MCKDKKVCSCGCKVKSNLKEAYSVNIETINDDILSVSGQDGMDNCTIDVEKYSDGSVSIIVNDDPAMEMHFEDFNSLVIFMGNDFVNEFGSDAPKRLFFSSEVIDRLNKFIKQPIMSINESKEHQKKITITVNDPENSIFELLNSIKRIGNTGHGFEIILDPELKPENDEDGIKTTFYWDGDGSDRIEDISLEEVGNMSDEDKKDVIDKDFDAVESELNESILKEYNDGSSEVYKLLVKHYKLMSKLDKQLNGKFTGFSLADTKLNTEAQSLKNQAWDISRKGGLDTNEMMKLDAKAKQSVSKIKKTVKESISLKDNDRRDLIKKTSAAIDSIYSIYSICESKKINGLTDELGIAFDGLNEYLTKLID